MSEDGPRPGNGLLPPPQGEIAGPARAYPVEIQQVENGFIIRVGCKTFVTKEWSEAWTELGAYFADPNKAALKWLRRKEANG